MKILVIQQKMIGDVLTSSILFSLLRESFPNATLHYLINSHTLPVVENHPDIDNFQIITPNIEKSSALFFSFLKNIQKENYNVVIDVYSTFSSNLITLFSGAKTKISKHKWYTSFLYTHTFKESKVPVSNAGLAIENRIKLLQPLGIKEILKYPQPKIHLKKDEIETAKKMLLEFKINLSSPLFMISILGSDKTKTYPLQYMAELIDFIVAETKGALLFNYIPNQIEDVKKIISFCKPETKKHIHLHVFGKNLREFIALTSHCNALIGNEGGAINMAKAIDKPTFSIFSPWILKEAWNIFEDGTRNDSIHLKDVKPELFTDTSPKQIKKQHQKLYVAFTPELIKPKLKAFLSSI
ncbi:lipopolysaccharide heptosyltransferase family protein [Hyunsoonleella flava]|uniref:Lipopolysaccharide heptosyltransferase family protein n=1 Tax=Hyunsoonleella flava TaxID=2527939 RepID=A0A4Q9FJG6_9FLAO|nr:glycosyltransferase family 9 protein [Hyunsoonleella flava]TBN06414.1 lipopolysaccharide heptosyltransferase family protein [Hyunsoonleella flava]